VGCLRDRGRGLLVGALALALLVSSAPPLLADQPTALPARSPHAPDEVLIQWKAGSSDADRRNARAAVGAARKEIISSSRFTGRGELELAKLPPGRAVADAVRGLSAARGVEFAEPNWIYTHQYDANDTYYTNGSLWGMLGDATSPKKNQYGSQAGEAWAAGYTGGKMGPVYVGVIDEGIQFTHRDLAARVWTNPQDPPDGVDNDGNGYVDDVHGWDFDANNNTIYDGSQDDHGTHVTGTIAATGNNSTGVVGVSWNVTYISAKFLGAYGGTTANAVKALDYLTQLKLQQGLNIVATNNSWSGGGFSQALLDAINRAGDADILFVAAAGNGDSSGRAINTDTKPQYPSSYRCDTKADGTPRGWDCVIAVTAIDKYGKKPSWANYGQTSVDLAAPGVAIYSTVPSSSYKSYSGTSQATPHVTGTAALIAGTCQITASGIRDAILGSVSPTSSVATGGTTPTATGGRLNARSALTRACGV
jgi:subtilisin family serine protease